MLKPAANLYPRKPGAKLLQLVRCHEKWDIIPSTRIEFFSSYLELFVTAILIERLLETLCL